MQGPSEMGASGRLVNWDRFSGPQAHRHPDAGDLGQDTTRWIRPIWRRWRSSCRSGELAATNGGHMDMYDDQPTYFAKLIAFLRKFR